MIGGDQMADFVGNSFGGSDTQVSQRGQTEAIKKSSVNADLKM